MPNPAQMRRLRKRLLVREIIQALHDWWDAPGRQLKTAEFGLTAGRIHVRRSFCRSGEGTDRLVLANLNWLPEFQGQGIFTALSEALKEGPWSEVEVENVLNLNFSHFLHQHPDWVAFNTDETGILSFRLTFS